MQSLVLRLLTLLLFLLPALTTSPNADLLNKRFYGEWKASKNPFQYFEYKTGNIEVTFGVLQQYPTTPEINSVELVLLDPIYHSDKLVRVKIPLSDASQKLQWLGTTSLTLELYDGGYKEFAFICETEYIVRVLETKEQQFWISLKSNQTSRDCLFRIQAQTHPQSRQIKVLYYCLFISALTTISVVCLLVYVKKHSEDSGALTKLSINSICLCLTQMWYLMVIHLYLAIQERESFLFFVIPIVLIAVQSAICVRLLVSVFKARYQHRLNRNKWMMLTLFVFFSFNGYLLLMYLYPYDNLTVLLQGLIILPQILKNSKQKSAVKISIYYLVGCYHSQFWMGLYYRGCPQNIYSVAPSFSFLFMWMGIYCMETSVLLVQRNIGGRFFIPNCMLRDNDSYFMMKQTNQEEDCGICIDSLVINQTFAKTKCGHSYHEFCLREWLRVNDKCPMCRTRLECLDQS